MPGCKTERVSSSLVRDEYHSTVERRERFLIFRAKLILVEYMVMVIKKIIQL